LIAYDDAQVGHSRAGNITGLLGLGNRGGGAAGGFLVGWLLAFVGYSSGAPVTPQLKEGLRLAISLVPSVLLFLMIPLLVWYPLTRRKMAEAEKVLRNRAHSTTSREDSGEDHQ
jgi:GPH family glycoside/pentoside/hexuronide:cation symporter